MYEMNVQDIPMASVEKHKKFQEIKTETIANIRWGIIYKKLKIIIPERVLSLFFWF